MSWFGRLLRRHRADAELDEEVQFYLDQETQRRIDRGESPEQARYAARRAFGNVTLVKETTRQMWGWTPVEDMARDVRYALRLLTRAPLLPAVAVLSLALSIGANTAIFSLADAVIFRDLPVHEPAALVQVRGVHQRGVSTIYSYPLYQDIRDRTRAFSSTVCAGSWAIVEPITLVLPNESRREMRVRFTAVSGNYFDALGIQPVIGRTFTPDEDRAPGAHPVAVISYHFWKRDLLADPGVVHTRVLHNGVGYQILGVMPPSFTGISSNDDPDVWVPMMMANALLARAVVNSGSSSLYVFGRLRPGTTAAQASTDIARVYGEIQRTSRQLQGHRGEAVSMSKGVQTLRAGFEKPLLVLLAVGGVLVLIACANLAALLMARAAARRHEIAVRLALGATRWRLVRQCLTESVLLGLLGGAAGLTVAWWGASSLIGMVTTSTRRLPLHFTIDTRLLAFTAGLSILAAVLFGLLPAVRAHRTPLVQASTLPRAHSGLPMGRFLIAGQMALSLFLLILAGLFVRSLTNLRNLDTGFARDNILIFMLDPRVAYAENLQNAIEIVGVVRDVQYNNLRKATPYTIYLPIQQSASQRLDLQVRTLDQPALVAAQVQEAVRRYDVGVRVTHAVTLKQLVEDSIAQDRLLALLAACVAILALLLSSVGLYGITSYAVHHRTQEIGVRLALGASRQSVRWMVLREVLILVVAGAAIGIPGALIASATVRGLLFGLAPTDPSNIAGATVALTVIAVLAGYLPAHRACRVDPMQALRWE
jgi:ABC-type antimicrobial peptide transport system permease subunit